MPAQEATGFLRQSGGAELDVCDQPKNGPTADIAQRLLMTPKRTLSPLSVMADFQMRIYTEPLDKAA